MLRSMFVHRTFASSSRSCTDQESFKYRPNLVFRKSKVTGKSVEKLINSPVPVPKVRAEFLFGIFPVLEALSAGKRSVHTLYMKDSVRNGASSDYRISRILQLSESRKIAIKRLTQSQLDKLTEFQVHNGVGIDCSPLSFSALSPFSLCVYLDRVLDPGNLGAIARSTLFFGGDSIMFAKGRGPSSLTPSMVKSSAGALEHLPVTQVESFADFLKFSKSINSQIVCTSDSSSANRFNRSILNFNQYQPDPSRPIVIVLGDEGKGISEEVMRECDTLITIPKRKREESTEVNSLNVSVVAGILLSRFQYL